MGEYAVHSFPNASQATENADYSTHQYNNPNADIG